MVIIEFNEFYEIDEDLTTNIEHWINHRNSQPSISKNRKIIRTQYQNTSRCFEYIHRDSRNNNLIATQVDTAEAERSTNRWFRPEVECWLHM